MSAELVPVGFKNFIALNRVIAIVSTGSAPIQRLIRDGNVAADNLDLSSLRREKDDVTEVREGFECGLTLRGFNDIKQGDVVECFEMREIPRA